ncbi:cell division cycle-associated protein 2 isoform X2 [Caloenas nicobarica]|uniref:cell division cycle-associated protein 2 isoform X2 n=1 Tax=Caloenas nicobarica TaxID=187106 RepID=UPI0032B74061
MRRRSMSKNAPLEFKENESRCAEEKEEASFPDLSKDQKICKATKSKVVKASKKENLPDGNQAQSQKRTRRYSKRLEKEPDHDKEGFGSCQFPERCFETLKGDMVGEPPLPLNSKENFPRCGPVSLGDECYLTPNRDKAEEKSDGGRAEKPRKTPVDFATVTIGEFGISQESFTKPSIGKSPTSLKFRRRSNIGARGSPENNTLIRFIAQQRSNRQKAAFTELSPFKHENVRSLKDKIDAFQTSFKLSEEEEEEEGETGFSGPSQVNDASQETGCSQDKAPFTKQQNLVQWSEEFMSANSGADLKDNLRHNLSNSIKSDTTICTILSSCQNVTVTEPAAAVSKEWVCKQHSPIKSLKAGQIGDILESGHDFHFDDIIKDVRSNAVSDLSRKKVNFAEEPSLEAFDDSRAPSTPLHTGNVSLNEHGQCGSRLPSILKKTPVKQLMESAKKSSHDAVGGGGGESLTDSSCAETFETLQTEETERQSSEKPKKRRVTFGEALSPEIFDETLPANTPLCKGATPLRHPGLQSNDFDCSDECVDPPQELVERSVAADGLSPVDNAEAETDKSDMITTRSSTKRKKTRRASYEKRRTKKVKKSLYGEREMASKKPLLTPIPEIPEVFFTSGERRVTRSMSVQLSLIF